MFTEISKNKSEKKLGFIIIKMTVYVFIIESAGHETFKHIFNGKEIYNIDEGTFVEGINTTELDLVIKELSTKFNDVIQVIFIDKRYVIKYFYTVGGKDYNEEILKLKKIHQFCNGTWMEFFDQFIGIDDSNHYIFATIGNYKNIYDYSNYLQISPNHNCYFIWSINNVSEIKNAKSYYNIFSRKSLDEQIDSIGNPQFIDYEAIKWIVNHGVKQVQGMLKCGIHRCEPYMQAFVENWILNPASYFSKGIIVEYDLYPPAPDSENTDIQKGYLYTELFNISSQYRFQILNGMCRVLCKYGLEFGKLKAISSSIFDVQYDSLLD